MRIATAQYPISFHQNLQVWINHVENWIKEAASNDAQILVFPEYGSMELVSLLPEEIRNDIQGQVIKMNDWINDFLQHYSNLAQKYQIVIVAPSFPTLFEDRIVNRAFVFGPNGEIGHQDKTFMTRFESEEWKVSTGDGFLTVFETPWGNFGIQICYDIEFPLGSKLLAEAGVDVILVPSCTETIRGATRVHVGARARAMENQIYTVVAQTIGNSEWSPAVDINYGYTAFYSTPDVGFPNEGILSIAQHQTEGWLHYTLEKELLTKVRESGSVFNYKDNMRLSITLQNLELKNRRTKIA